MCGIAGVLNADLQRPADRAVLDRMLESMVHRGPDDEGVLVDGPLAMGMRRLSIIDLEGGRQPMFDESRRYGVIFNGEIYNYRELRHELTASGHLLRTKSDTEVIVHLFARHGAGCLEFLRGMFCFAIWDHQQRELFVARDRLGIKPFYYAQPDGSFVFGSEIKAILQHPTVTPGLELQGLGEYLSLKYVAAPRTMFQGIHALPPAHYLSVKNAAVQVCRYWDVTYDEPARPASPEEYEAELDHLLRESVRLRLRSDVGFGALLSGGLDSSAIVAMIRDELNEPVKTFSVGFEGGDEADELPYARQVAERFECDHHEITVRATDFVEQAERVIWHLDQPIADQATMATYMVAQLASDHVKVVLSGEGGDELFAGYARYVGEQYAPYFRWLPDPLGRLTRKCLPLLPGMRRQKIALNALTLRDETRRFTNWFPLFNDETKSQLVTQQVREYLTDSISPLAAQLQRCCARSPLNRMLYVDTKLWLPDYLLLRNDKLTMAHSVEARVPLLDHKLVEFAARVPADMKIRQGTRKFLLKQVAARRLPDTIVHRKKQGFPIPIAHWLRHEARDMVGDLLAPDTVRQRGLFNPAYVQKLRMQHENRYADHSSLLWGLMSLELWMRQFRAASTSART